MIQNRPIRRLSIMDSFTHPRTLEFVRSGTILTQTVSTNSMSPFPRLRRTLRITLFAVLGLILAVAAYVPIQQRILRWRAEHLLADIRSLELGKSTWDDTQKIMHRWGAWGFYQGSCTRDRCSYQIYLPDTYERLEGILPSGCCDWMLRSYQFLGGRNSFTLARLEVISGLVWGKDFALAVRVPKGKAADEPEYELVASAATVWRTEHFYQSGRIVHPEYFIGRPGACEGCEAMDAMYTPFAEPGQINSLLDFNLDCLTRRSPCQKQVDIMPSVWRRLELEKQDAKRKDITIETPTDSCSLSPEFLGRDRANVAVGEVASMRLIPDDRESRVEVGFYLSDRLKRAAFWNVDEVYRAVLPRSAIQSKDGSGNVAFAPGHKLILTFRSPYEVEPRNSLDLDPCEVIPFTEPNLAHVKDGIMRDIFPESTVKWP